MSSFNRRGQLVLAAMFCCALLSGCERPPVDSVQHGYRGTGMLQVYNPRTLAGEVPNNTVPAPIRVRNVPGAPKAKELYESVQVLGDLSVVEFGRTMAAITQWVAPPAEGCNYCHIPGNLADDSKYTKVVARRMLQMTREVNLGFKAHVAETGVTCWTCHRGQAVPQFIWFKPTPQDLKANFIGDLAQQNQPSPSVGLASLPFDPFSEYFVEARPIRVIGNAPLPGAQGANNRSSIKQAEFTYGLMMHMSDALGVNCTYCHNSRAFGSWQESPPQRVAAWQGIGMVRHLNREYLNPLQPVYPPQRLGPTGDAPKAYCTTCHQGAYKPMFGAPMARDYPALTAPDLSTVGEQTDAAPAADAAPKS